MYCIIFPLRVIPRSLLPAAGRGGPRGLFRAPLQVLIYRVVRKIEIDAQVRKFNSASSSKAEHRIQIMRSFPCIQLVQPHFLQHPNTLYILAPETQN